MKHTMRLLWEKKKTKEACLLRVYAETSEIKIPAYIEHYPITEIGAYCFSASEHIEGKQFYTTELLIENDEENIKRAEEMKKEIISRESQGVNTTILRMAAGDDLIKLCLPDTIYIINNAAFYNCRKLESLEIGADTTEIGSDVFTNCVSLKQLHIRCRDYKAESAKALLSRISTELEVYYYESIRKRIDNKKMPETNTLTKDCRWFEYKKQLFASLLYPEYFETYDEIAPAHIFGRHIEGEGFRARQCFKNGQILFGEYDKIFQKAKAEEAIITIGRMCMHRLLFPVELSKDVKENYKLFLQENEQEIGIYFVKQKKKAEVKYYFQHNLLSCTGIDTLITCAANFQWSEGVSAMLHWKKQFYGKTRKTAYEFEPL